MAENNWSGMAIELSNVASGLVKKLQPEWDPRMAANDELAAAMRAVMVPAMHTPGSSTDTKNKTWVVEHCHHAATNATPVVVVKQMSFLILT